MTDKTAEQLAGEVKAAFDKSLDAVKVLAEEALGKANAGETLSNDLKEKADDALTKLHGVEAEIKDLKQKLARGDVEGPERAKTIGEQVAESDGLKSFAANGARGSIRIQVKDITSIAGSAGTLIQNDRQPGVYMLPKRPMTIRSLLNQATTNSNMIEYVKQLGFTNNAAVVSEGVQKPESEITFESATAPVRLIAHWVHISRQAMDDAPQIRGIIDTELRYGLDYAEEVEILTGDGTGQHLDGLIANATAYSGAFVPDSPTEIDVLRLAILQASLALFPATGIVLHPQDWARVALTKTTDGAYLFVNPTSMEGPRLWGLPVLPSLAMTVDKFLVGAFNVAATIWDRMGEEVLISSEDRDNFVKNMLTVRAEKRLALTVQRPEALIYGDFGNHT